MILHGVIAQNLMFRFLKLVWLRISVNVIVQLKKFHTKQFHAFYAKTFPGLLNFTLRKFRLTRLLKSVKTEIGTLWNAHRFLDCIAVKVKCDECGGRILQGGDTAAKWSCGDQSGYSVLEFWSQLDFIICVCVRVCVFCGLPYEHWVSACAKSDTKRIFRNATLA